MKEIYKDIKGYEGYQVSNLGNVKSFKGIKERILKNNSCGDGYLAVALHESGKQKTFKIHKLVAVAFLNHTPNGHKIVIDHINSIKTDNRLENLQLITNRENLSKDKKGSSSYTGVCWREKANKWTSSIYINGKRKYLGSFNTERIAHIVYQKALKKHLDDTL